MPQGRSRDLTKVVLEDRGRTVYYTVAGLENRPGGVSARFTPSTGRWMSSRSERYDSPCERRRKAPCMPWEVRPTLISGAAQSEIRRMPNSRSHRPAADKSVSTQVCPKIGADRGPPGTVIYLIPGPASLSRECVQVSRCGNDPTESDALTKAAFNPVAGIRHADAQKKRGTHASKLTAVHAPDSTWIIPLSSVVFVPGRYQAIR